ncbi:MAG: NUDIX hydrolase [Alphaproteobacteria bacterium]|nr:NUDIX hydrolase [Alphaproteobacteria bacterium]
MKVVSCGVIVTDGSCLLLGHATRSPRWDIPKGLADPGESHIAAARRELAEETGLEAPETALHPLGVFAYLRNKDLALFAWAPSQMPDPKHLVCTVHVTVGATSFPEFDRFGLFTQAEALEKVGKNMARVLGGMSLAALCASK